MSIHPIANIAITDNISYLMSWKGKRRKMRKRGEEGGGERVKEGGEKGERRGGGEGESNM
jgi:hypothetical protein